MVKGCIKYTCTQPRPRKYEWKKDLARTKCCSFNQTFHPVGTLLHTQLLPDECTTVSLKCKKKEVFTNLEIEVEDDCPDLPGIMNVVTESNTTIQSARFPSPFPPKQEECWMRTPSCGHSVKLEFLEFDVGSEIEQNVLTFLVAEQL